MPKPISERYRIGAQWQHKVTRECITIMNTDSHERDMIVYYLTEDGCRKSMSAREMVEVYRFVEKMNGAYK